MKVKIVYLFGVIAIGFCLTVPVQGAAIQKKWHFGEGLDAGDEFTFSICDPVLRIPETDDHCYVATMRFLALLPTDEGMTWIVATQIDHKTNTVRTVFQISADSFKIKTDGVNIAYADSIDRTVGWIRQFSNENKPQPLNVGRSWGTVRGDSVWSAPIIVEMIDYGGFEIVEPTYLLSYSLLKESRLQIRDGFPFPLKATVYKPVSSHQDIPLAFAFEIIKYQNADNDTCSYITPSKNAGPVPSQQNESYPPLADHKRSSQNQTHIDIEEFTIDEILRRTNDNSTIQELLKSTYGEQYREKLLQSVYNFTKFIEIIANATSTTFHNR
jgi:hypothetical protein